MLRFTPWFLLLLGIVHFIVEPMNTAVVLYGAGTIILISWSAILHLHNKLWKLKQEIEDIKAASLTAKEIYELVDTGEIKGE